MATDGPVTEGMGEKLLSATREEAAALATGGMAFVKGYTSGTRSARADVTRSKVACEEYIKQHREEFAQGEKKAEEVYSLCVRYVVMYFKAISHVKASEPVLFVVAMYVRIARLLYQLYLVLPVDALKVIGGVCLCFFGGTYYASIAVIEACRHFGGDLLLDQLEYLWEEGTRAEAAMVQDMDVDNDGDGVKDVSQMSHSELLTHETFVVLAAVKDPTAATKALTYLSTMWISVIAVVRCEFATTVALCLGIAEILELPMVRVLAPPLAHALGPRFSKWTFPFLSSGLKILAVTAAAYVQSYISAFYSGLRGGAMFAEGLIALLATYGVMDKLAARGFTVATDKDGNFDAKMSIVDECMAYPLAAAGFWWQFTNGFRLPFPWSLPLLPLTILEWFLEWEVFSSALDAAAPAA